MWHMVLCFMAELLLLQGSIIKIILNFEVVWINMNHVWTTYRYVVQHRIKLGEVIPFAFSSSFVSKTILLQLV